VVLGYPPQVTTRKTLGEREFIFFMALVSAMSALAIDLLLPAFADMRPAFDLEPDATDLSLTITLFFMGTGVGNLFWGPIADAKGRKPVLVVSMALYGVGAFISAFAPSLAVLYAARFLWGIASAGPRTLTQAIVRDRYSGDAMARIMTLVQTAFFLAPVIAPVLGKGLVELGSWRYVMGFGVVSAVAVILWSLRLEETLDPAHRRPLNFKGTVRGFQAVIANKVTRGYLLAVTFSFGAFFSFLSSSELLFEDVFDRSSWFVPFFSIVSVLFGGVALATNRLLRRTTGRNVAMGAGVGMLVASVALLAVALITDGTPNVVLFLVVFTVANACHVGFFPTANSLALEPMGQMAGTAAAVLGFTTSVGGALLASLINRSIDGSVTPMALGYAVYVATAVACQAWAAHHAKAMEPVDA
jgi:DHA1 family bicyclomycin/chloramphenicol resistance-like MFS transporter